MSKEKELEEKKENKEYFPIDKQKNVKALSKFFSIIGKIGRVFMLIGAFCLVLLMIIVPSLMANVKVHDNHITVFNKEVTFEENDDQIELSIDNVKIGSLTDKDNIAFNSLINRLENYNSGRIVLYLEFSFLVGIGILVLMYIIMTNGIKFFDNIHDKDTQFIEENITYLKNISRLSAIAFIVSIVCDILSIMIFTEELHININIPTLSFILFICFITYIFEYALVIQKNSKVRIYSE